MESSKVSPIGTAPVLAAKAGIFCEHAMQTVVALSLQKCNKPLGQADCLQQACSSCRLPASVPAQSRPDMLADIQAYDNTARNICSAGSF